jgi:hypothetical protein
MLQHVRVFQADLLYFTSDKLTMYFLHYVLHSTEVSAPLVFTQEQGFCHFPYFKTGIHVLTETYKYLKSTIMHCMGWGDGVKVKVKVEFT